MGEKKYVHKWCKFCDECNDCDCGSIFASKREDEKWMSFSDEVRGTYGVGERLQPMAAIVTYHFGINDGWHAISVCMATELARSNDDEYSVGYQKTLVPLSEVLGVPEELMREYAIVVQGIAGDSGH